MSKKRGKRFKDRKRKHFFDPDCCPVEVEAIADPLAQATQDKSNNAGANLIDNPDESDICIERIVTERGPGRQKVV
ncbi:hypothetical protein ACFO25_17990 [Paenactinomyces guangxiensis]|uniref:Uncharacterized protein n=1 Tax=Paenactinomyces guangxiensis TaxID=1490290 RepID=A0A7W2A8X2_9BACL|nr:hypothetical protein [Paenactinomyces guangxiensis]MBA4494644.1 hypothetical protein [Paenactinomyces guangxiensis]MBH8591728.1 hypothetical protein [Paenactinomyces guangxiensis]